MTKPECGLGGGPWTRVNWDHLRFFLAVARTGTLAAAANLLTTDHTTVSRRIKRLEQEIGVKLFRRSNAGYSLTSAGERLLAASDRIETALFEGVTMAASDHGALSGKVRIGAPDGLGSLFLARQIPKLLETNKELEVELIATARSFDVITGEADIAISIPVPRQSRLVYRRLTDYALMIYGSRDYLARHPVSDPRDLGRHGFIGYVERDLYAPELDYLDAVAPNLGVPLRSTNLLAQVHATLAGHGLCVLPAFVAHHFTDLFVVLPEHFRLQRSFFIQTHEDRRATPLIRSVIDFIIERARAERAVFLPDAGTMQEWARVRAKMHSTRVELLLPRFESGT
ncbi:LysR family transcriptional regulator [Marinibacterium sp. SX1]|uniref:LysR family transcriptional regulator n=1 Tax=Marinibacterium sp. SX1 TaxID=3388424 RepID=UPI003D16B5BA